MKTMLSCIVLAALVALVLADGVPCDLEYKSGQKLEQTFCGTLNDTMNKCMAASMAANKPNFAGIARRSAESKEDGQSKPNFFEAHIAAFKESCEKTRQCIEKDVKDEVEYKKIITFCSSTTTEDNHNEVDENGNKVLRNLNACVGFNGMLGCGIKFNFGGNHEWGHHNKHDKGNKDTNEEAVASFIAPNNPIMSMFL